MHSLVLRAFLQPGSWQCVAASSAADSVVAGENNNLGMRGLVQEGCLKVNPHNPSPLFGETWPQESFFIIILSNQFLV